MSESPTQTSGPSLEQILWRSLDRWREEPALLDSEEFAEHIAGAFEGKLPEEAFADHFFEGVDRLHQPGSLAEAVVRRAPQRLHAYEFDLNRLEYVIVEDKDKVVVVSEFGQFTLPNDDAVRRALEAAVVKAPDRGGGEPRGYLVRKSGEVVGFDVNKVARTLDRLIVHQISAPAVDAPARRLASFNPVRRAMTEVREERALGQDRRFAAPPTRSPEAPHAEAAHAALLVLMPDGSLARARIGAASRWEQMLGERARPGGQRIAIQTGNVLAIVNGANPGSAGERALAHGEALAAVRSDGASVRGLGGDELARELVAAGWVAPALAEDRFWIQPEQAFRPETAGPSQKALVAQPLQLGQITGDPWADWALTAGAPRPLRISSAAPAREELPVPPPGWNVRMLRAHALQLAGAPVVAFRAPDGTVLANPASPPVRLAGVERRDAPFALHRNPDPLPRAGAMPFTALQALQLALERTASTGAYRLPVARLDSAPDAIPPGEALRFPPVEDRHGKVRLADPVRTAGWTGRLVRSMPFPNRGELHVGDDLTAALNTWLAASVRPAPTEPPSLRLRGEGSTPPVAPRALRELHGQAMRSAQDAALILDFPALQPLLGGHPSISGLPFLLRRAMAQGGDWTPGPGASLPSAVHDFAVRAPFAATLEIPAPAATRPPRPGEDELIIPLPLWAQMGRGEIAETDRIMAAPLVPAGYAPPLGVYRLVVPGGGPLDLTEGAPQGATMELSGPTGLRLGPRPSGTVTATTLVGSHFLGPVPLDEGGAQPRGRSRFRVGAPIEAADLSPVVTGARDMRPGEPSLLPPLSSSFGSPQTAAPADTSLAAGAAAFRARAAAAGVAAVVGPGSSATQAPVGSVLPAPAGGAARSAPALGTRSVVTGLSPGMWSGHRRSLTAYYQPRAFGARYRNEPQMVGGVDLSGFSRPRYPQLPTALRFRYVAAPLWWSASTADASFDSGAEFSTASGAMRAANSAASIWRSILVASARHEDVTGGMDNGREAAADAMSSVARKLEGLPAPLAAAPPEPTRSADAPAYIAMSSSGAAGAVSRSAAARARAQAVEMSIVAAIPPAPPPLESMSSVARGGEAPHARGRGGHQVPQGHAKDADDPVSQSKIEGSVDAIAQRIYHRIRRRIQSDRERFGG